MNEFCENLKRLMKRKDYDVAKLSKLSGLPHALISKFIRGEKEPSVEYLISLSLGLNCTVDELVGIESITVFERRLLEAYRDLPEGERKKLVELILLSDPFFNDDPARKDVTVQSGSTGKIPIVK